MAISRHTEILNISIDSSVIPHVREGGAKTEVHDLGSSAITPYFLLGRLSTTGAIAKYQEDLANQEVYAIMESYNKDTNECKLLKNCVAVMDKLSMLNTDAAAEIVVNTTNLTALQVDTLDYNLRKINIDTI